MRTSVALLFVCALVAPAAAITRERVTFRSNGTQIVGYHYSPNNTDKAVGAVLIAHGLGGLQTSRLQPFAERFANAGYHSLTFDYRYWGQSAGQPRNIIDINSQQNDYINAVTFVKTLKGVDPNKVVLWGTSLSGGHVLTLGAKNLPGVAAVLAMCPHTNGLATVGSLPIASLPGLVAAGLADAGRGAAGQSPLYIPLANKTGEFGALTQEGAYEGYQFVQPSSPSPGNVLAARFVLEIPFYFPDFLGSSSTLPTFVAVGSTDNVVTPEPARVLARRLPKGELKEYPGGHFSVYPGASNYPALVEDEVAFLLKNVPL